MSVVTPRSLDQAAVVDAARLIAPHIRRTPTERSEALSTLSGREVYLKLENLQKTGAFKIRGALHALMRRDPRERASGVVTASAGNHGQGIAYAAQLVGVPATVVLPQGVSLAKLIAIQRTGAETVLSGESYDEAQATALELAREKRRAYVHAFDDDDVIAGQGTLALELLEDVPDVDTLVVPVGGGGLIAGVALVAAARSPRPRIIGVQAAGASAFADSFAAGKVVERPAATIADGIAVRRPAERTLAIVKRLVDDVITVSDEAIARAIVVLLERAKLLAEGAGAAGLGAVLEADGRVGGRKVGVVISGGNIDANLLTKALQQGLVSAGRYLAFRTWLDDKPGMLHLLTGLLAREHINILHVGIHRLGPYAALGRVGLDVIVDTRDRAHADAVLALVRGQGFAAEELLATPPGGG
ncbi:MAG TPA: threonine ammonia-lyase [Candidatus Limnocylindria bacterium]|jgi:threonine dehydratase|nr:threonine ammonia-lyase [Candidatus Limnocylindria bacterium]